MLKPGDTDAEKDAAIAKYDNGIEALHKATTDETIYDPLKSFTTKEELAECKRVCAAVASIVVQSKLFPSLLFADTAVTFDRDGLDATTALKAIGFFDEKTDFNT